MSEASAGVRWSGRSDRGRVRRHNEDSFLGLQFNARETHLLGKVGEAPLNGVDYLFAVSDGIGGAKAGEFASRIAIEKITRLLPRTYLRTARSLEESYGEVLAELYGEIHRALLYVGSSYEECQGMGATLTLCWFTPARVFFGHIGDSRLYHMPASEPHAVRQLSHDDTHVGWLQRAGKISENEARRHPSRHMLQRALGAGYQFVEPQAGSLPLLAGDRFLLCSDGVVDGLCDWQILESLGPGGTPSDPALAAHRLVDRALEQSGRDNTTAIVVEVLAP